MRRRHFLMTAGAAAQAVWGQSASNQVTLAYIGVGNRGAYLLEAGMEQPNGRVTAICDIKPDRLDKAATAAAKSKPFTTRDWRQILARPDVDAVFIATPPHLHVEMAIAALQAGKHVYCEKPIGVTPASVRDLVKAAKASSKVFQAGQQMRSYRQQGEVVRQIREGVIGDVLFIKAQRHATADLDHNASSADWYFDDSKSGGYLVEQSVHNLDACNWAAGQHPSRCVGFGGVGMYKNDPPGRDIMDHASLTYEYPNGAKLSFTQLVFHPKGMPAGGQLIQVHGTKGSVEMMGANAGMLYPRDGQPKEISPKVEEPPHAHITAFLDCIQKGAKSPADITVGATAALTAIMAHDACTKGKVINWSDLRVEV